MRPLHWLKTSPWGPAVAGGVFGMLLAFCGLSYTTFWFWPVMLGFGIVFAVWSIE